MKKENKEKKEQQEFKDDFVELNIEELTDIQGGIEDDDKTTLPTCGLGCFQGAGTPNEDLDK